MLCVDDQPYNIFVLSSILKFINPQIVVDEAFNGHMAIEIINQNSPYDFIFMDINMPVLDGYQVSIFKVFTYYRLPHSWEFFKTKERLI